MTDTIRTTLPDQVTEAWCVRQAARVLLGAETVMDSGDRVATYVSLAEAWRELADSMRGE